MPAPAAPSSARQVGPALLAAERAWDAFRRTYRAREREAPGSGEGLAAQVAETLREINFQHSDSARPTPDP